MLSLLEIYASIQCQCTVNIIKIMSVPVVPDGVIVKVSNPIVEAGRYINLCTGFWTCLKGSVLEWVLWILNDGLIKVRLLLEQGCFDWEIDSSRTFDYDLQTGLA